MPTDCLDSDSLVSIGLAFNWDCSGGLAHLSSCGTCRDALQDLERVHGALAHRAEPGRDLVDAVGAAIDAQRQLERQSPAPLPEERTYTLAVGVVAALACFVILVGQASASAQTVQTVWLPAAVLSVAMGAGVVWRSRRV
ncbi:MAG TPA: hypothetical protein VMT45_15135 [Thermoanaerobaculaceae bacterium]|nr:hypothetical protein [Thermoanaerobaculaceae bacterium]